MQAASTQPIGLTMPTPRPEIRLGNANLGPPFKFQHARLGATGTNSSIPRSLGSGTLQYHSTQYIILRLETSTSGDSQRCRRGAWSHDTSSEPQSLVSPVAYYIACHWHCLVPSATAAQSYLYGSVRKRFLLKRQRNLRDNQRSLSALRGPVCFLSFVC